MWYFPHMNQHEATVTDGDELQQFIAEAIALVGECVRSPPLQV